MKIEEQKEIEKIKKATKCWLDMNLDLEENKFDFEKFKRLLIDTAPLLQKYISSSIPIQIVSLLIEIKGFQETAYFNTINNESYVARKIASYLCEIENSCNIYTDDETKKTCIFVFGDTRPHNIYIEENIDLSDLLTDIL